MPGVRNGGEYFGDPPTTCPLAEPFRKSVPLEYLRHLDGDSTELPAACLAAAFEEKDALPGYLQPGHAAQPCRPQSRP